MKWPAIEVVLLAVLAMTGCDAKQTYRWKEEVLLHDGRVIVIERSVKTGYVPIELGQPPGESDYTLTFTGSDGRPVTWEAGRSFWPMILDFVDGAPYVVALGSTAPDYEKHGCPRPPYFIFRHAGGRWERIAYEELPKAIRRGNLLVDPTDPDGGQFDAVKRGVITEEQVKRSHRWLDVHYREVREDAPNPCAHRGDDYRYVPLKQGRQENDK